MYSTHTTIFFTHSVIAIICQSQHSLGFIDNLSYCFFLALTISTTTGNLYLNAALSKLVIFRYTQMPPYTQRYPIKQVNPSHDDDDYDGD